MGARHFASLVTQMDQLSGLTRKIDSHVWFSAARLVSPPRTASFFWIFCWTWNIYIMKLCVIYEESTLFVRHIGFSVLKKKAAYHSAGSNARDFWPWDHWSWFWVVLNRKTLWWNILFSWKTFAINIKFCASINLLFSYELLIGRRPTFLESIYFPL